MPSVKYVLSDLDGVIRHFPLARDRVLQEMYQSMFRAKQMGNHAVADKLMIEIEKVRQEKREQVDKARVESLRPQLPDYVRSVLGKTQDETGWSERSNCINAAFNFHDGEVRWAEYSTMEFLNRIKNDFIQLGPTDKAQLGDLVVLWTRSGGSWDARTIDVHQMDPSDADFPYGLVFDHVAVRLSSELVFHKPDPTLQSRYQIEPLNSILSVTSLQRGFEITYHRKK